MEKYRQFLEDFCSSHPNPNEAEPLPFRLQVFYLNDDDLDAECADWCHQYLAHYKCPWQLANQISLKAVENMKEFDLSEYYEEMHDDEPNIQTPEDNKQQTEADSEKKDDDEKKSPDAEQEEEGWSKLEFKEEKHPPRLMAELVAPLVFMEVRRVCHEMKGNLPNVHCQAAKYETSSHAIRNTRRKMEDRHVVVPDVNDYLGKQYGPLTSFYGVYDGHGGVDGANFAAAHLHYFLAKNKNFSTDLRTAIIETYKQTDDEFTVKAKQENISCGSTAVTAVFRDKTLYVTWLGDSQALLVRNGQPVTIMNPHKPEREDERQRIEALGGCVVFFGAWRVNGNLSVSRAIGDHEHKPFVGADPDMIKIDLEGNEDYLVLACDGLWDTLMPNALVELVQDHVKEHGDDTSEVAQRLVRAAKEHGSNDNITCVVIFLKDAAKILETQSASEPQSEKISENNNPEKGSDSKDSDDQAKDPDADSKSSDKESGNSDQNPKDEGSTERVAPLLAGILELSSESSEEVVILGSSDSVHMSAEGSDFNKDSSNNETSDEFIHAQVSSDSGQSPGQSGQRSRSGSGYQKPMIVVSSESGESESVSNSPSPNGSEEKQTTASDSQEPSSHQSSTQVDVHSSTSGTELALMSKTASKCLSNRKAKRSKNGTKNGSKNGRNGHHNGHRHNGHHTKDSRRFSRGRINSTSLITYRTLSAPPRSRSAESDLALAQRNMQRSGDQIFEMLTGCSTSFIRKTNSSSKWTVAVEMEAASSLFPDNRLIAEDRRRSDTPQHYRKK